MKKLIIAFAFLIITVFVNKYTSTFTDLKMDIHTTTLIGMGLALFVAFSFAELGKIVGLPMVTGFILTGLALGPELGNLLSLDVVNRLKMFNTLAIGIIALSAGIELDIKSLGKDVKSLSSTILGKIFFLLLFIAPVVYLYETQTHFFGLSESQKIVLAILFSVFGLGTSPAIVLAILSETKAKGRISNLVLNNAILKDFVVVIVLAIALGFCTAFLSGSAVSVDAIVQHVTNEIGLSVLFGIIFGALIVFYFKYVNVDTLLFIIALILVIAEISRLYHLEFLLVLITAGAIVKNTTKFGDDLHHLLLKVSLPVFIIFFTNAGAAIQLNKTLSILPLAILIVLMRFLALFISSKLSSKLTKEAPVVARNIWLGYIPQAGVTLGLIEIVAQRIPTMASEIYLLGVGVVSINLIVGPIAFKFSLKRANEVPDEIDDDVKERVHTKENDLFLSNKLAIPKFQTCLPNENLKEKILKIENLKVEKYEEVRASLVMFLSTLLEEQKKASLVFVEKIKLASQGYIAHQNFSSFDEVKRYTYTAKNIKNLGHVFHGLIQNYTDESLGITKKSILKVPVRMSVLVKATGVFSKDEKRDVPLQVIVKTYAREFLYNMHYSLLDEVVQNIGESMSGYFAENETNTLDSIASCIEKIIQFEFEKMESVLVDVLSEKVTHAIEVGINKSESLSKKNISIIELEDKINKTLYQSQKYFDSITNSKCFNNNIAYLKESITKSLQDTFYQSLNTLSQNIKSHSAPLFIKIDRLKKQLNDSGNDSEVLLNESEVEDEITGVDIKINPYILENRFRLDLRQLSETILNVELIFEPMENSNPKNVLDLKFKKVDLTGVLRQLEILELLPKIEKQLEDLFDVIDRVRFEHAEVLAQIKSLSVLIPEMTDITKRSALIQLDSLRRTFSQELAELTDALNEFIHGSSTFSHATVESLYTKIYQRKLATNTVGRLSYVVNSLKNVYKNIIPITIRAFKEILSKIIKETSVLHSPDKILFSRGRVRAVSKDFKQRIDRLLFMVAFKRNSLLSDFYKECFSLEPIRSSSHMITNKKILNRILEIESDWSSVGRLKIIVLYGANGSGKTSLLNVLQNEMSTREIYRINDDYETKVGGLYSLIQNHVRMNKKEFKVVLCDNLDHWPKKSVRGEEDFMKLMTHLMLNKDSNTFLVCTVNKLNLDYLNSTFDLDLVTSRTYTLEQLDSDSIEELISHRQWQSGQKLSFENSVKLPFVGNDFYLKRIYRKILNESQDLRACLTMWLYLVDEANDGITKINNTKNINLKGLQVLISYLPNDVFLVYRYFFHFGESSTHEVMRALLVEKDHVSRCLNYLENAGILNYNPKNHRYDLDIAVRSILENKFINNLALKEGESYGLY